jgi:uncharacterized peroxidase-related enzyme
MPRIQPVDREAVPEATQKLLAGVEKKLGMVPNLIATLAQSTSAAQAFLGFSQALAGGVISPQLREQIALAVSEANQCGYCVAAHSAVGSSVGLSVDQLRDARTATSPDRQTEVALQFARCIVDKQGFVSNDDIEDMRNAGYAEQAIVEVTAHVALNIFTNYFNHVAETDVDFPAVAELNAA